MDGPTCATCHHWSPRFPGCRFAPGEPTPPGYGHCDVLSHPPGVKTVNDEPSEIGLIAFVDSDDRYVASYLLTRPDFGCRAHAPRRATLKPRAGGSAARRR